MTCVIPKCFDSLCSYKSFPITNTPYKTGDAIIKDLSLFSESKELIDEAQKKIQELGFGSLEVLLLDQLSGFDGLLSQNRIKIKADLPAALQRGVFLFELTNIIQFEEHVKTTQNLWRGAYHSSEEYVRAKEFIEYKGLVRSAQVSRKINSLCDNGLKPYLENSSGLYPNENVGFEDYYTNLLSDSHKEYYRKSWKIKQNVTNGMIGIAATAAAILVVWSISKIFKSI